MSLVDAGVEELIEDTGTHAVYVDDAVRARNPSRRNPADAGRAPHGRGRGCRQCTQYRSPAREVRARGRSRQLDEAASRRGPEHAAYARGAVRAGTPTAES